MDNRLPDPDLGPGNQEKVAASEPMVHGFGGHRAPLGMRFLIPGLEPQGYEGAALVALHGSWNRSEKAGYKVVSLHWDAEGNISQRDFMTGFLHGDDVSGRPADVEQGPDGAIYVADDYAGTVYRIAREEGPSGASSIAPNPEIDLVVDWDLPESWSDQAAALYQDRNCAGCHERQADGSEPAVGYLDGIGSRYGSAELAKLLETPPGNMPDPELNEIERQMLARWLAETWP